MDLKNKKVLVTGGGARIGACICRAFALEGARIIIHYNNSVVSAQKLFIELGGKEKGHFLTKGDLTSQNYLESLMSEFSDIDIVVNNASVFYSLPLIEEDLLLAKEQFEVNFWAPVSLMQFFRKQNPNNGLIINILDQKIYAVGKNDGSYLLSKKILADATLMAALQWAPEIRVNGIAPGVVVPPVWLPDSKMKKSIKKTPLKISTSIDEVGNACLFLARNDSITGEIITLDSGLHLMHQ